jgi:hypothetical protein
MPIERRPLDHQLVAQVGKPEEEVVAWWKARLEQIAAIPITTARTGALVPEWRELAALPKAQRVALTRARVLAFLQLTEDQRARILEGRAVAATQLPQITAADEAFLETEVVPSLPSEIQRRVQAAAAQR